MRFSGENEMAITLAWDNKFEVGHERIDSEHRIFLSLIRDLSVEAESKAGKPRVERTLNEIYKYADFHFTSEENTAMPNTSNTPSASIQSVSIALLGTTRS